MKKKSCMRLLSLSLVLSNLAPVMGYAEENEILTEDSVEINDNDMDEIFKIDYKIIKGVDKDDQIS